LDKYDANAIEEMRTAQQGGLETPTRSLKQNLIVRGIPADEIRFVQEANHRLPREAGAVSMR
jgi:hypothetical protein